MIAELQRIARWCDGLRCDMAMLVLPEVFRQTWGREMGPFWPRAIGEVHREHPGFVFVAEVYWDLEWTLQQQGFDYTYDKRLYDRLRSGKSRPVREHFGADLEYQRRSVRFLENRAAAAFPPDRHRAAAVLAFLCPGLRFFHQVSGRAGPGGKGREPHHCWMRERSIFRTWVVSSQEGFISSALSAHASACRYMPRW